MSTTLKRVFGILLLGAFTFSCQYPNAPTISEQIPKQGALPLPIYDFDDYKTQILGVDLKAKSAVSVEVNWQAIEPLLKQAQEETGSVYVAVFGIIDSTGSLYDYHLQPLLFSQEALAGTHGKVRPFIYEIIKDGQGDHTTMRVAVAYIPDSDAAQQEFTDWLKPDIDPALTVNPKQKMKDTYTCYYSMEQIGNTVYLTPLYCEMSAIEVIEDPDDTWGPDGNNGDNLVDHDWNWPDDDDLNHGGGGGGNLCYPPFNCGEEDPEPCETGDEVLDNEDVQTGLEELWKDSNYGSDSNPNSENNRKEQVGFITPNTFGGYTFQRLSIDYIISQTACKATFKKPDNLPSDAILVHSHPYKRGDLQKECISGQTFKYRNKVGIEDGKTVKALGLKKGIIIDADRITVFDENRKTLKKETRCGY